jgi:hypothetical protein
MSEMIERVAEAMYWGRVNPNKGNICLSVAVAPWADLADEHRSGIQLWHCKSFWRESARHALEAMREPTDEMLLAGGNQLDCPREKQCWQAMIDAALISSTAELA